MKHGYMGKALEIAKMLPQENIASLSEELIGMDCFYESAEVAFLLTNVEKIGKIAVKLMTRDSYEGLEVSYMLSEKDRVDYVIKPLIKNKHPHEAKDVVLTLENKNMPQMLKAVEDLIHMKEVMMNLGLMPFEYSRFNS
jgi:hypothetical protein